MNDKEKEIIKRIRSGLTTDKDAKKVEEVFRERDILRKFAESLDLNRKSGRE